jgi:hypothetical protein
MGSGGLADGQYSVELLKTTPRNVDQDDFCKEKLDITYRVLAGPLQGQEVIRTVNRRFTPKSNLAKLATSLKGVAIAPGESFDFAHYYGTRGILLLQSGNPDVFFKDHQPPQAMQPAAIPQTPPIPQTQQPSAMPQAQQPPPPVMPQQPQAAPPASRPPWEDTRQQAFERF